MVYIVSEQYEALKKKEVCPLRRLGQQFPYCVETCRNQCAEPLAHPLMPIAGRGSKSSLLSFSLPFLVVFRSNEHAASS